MPAAMPCVWPLSRREVEGIKRADLDRGRLVLINLGNWNEVGGWMRAPHDERASNFQSPTSNLYRLMTFPAALSASMMSGMPPTMPTCTLSRRLK